MQQEQISTTICSTIQGNEPKKMLRRKPFLVDQNFSTSTTILQYFVDQSSNLWAFRNILRTGAQKAWSNQKTERRERREIKVENEKRTLAYFLSASCSTLFFI